MVKQSREDILNQFRNIDERALQLAKLLKEQKLRKAAEQLRKNSEKK